MSSFALRSIILSAQARDPEQVQKHIKKCFEGNFLKISIAWQCHSMCFVRVISAERIGDVYLYQFFCLFALPDPTRCQIIGVAASSAEPQMGGLHNKSD